MPKQKHHSLLWALHHRERNITSYLFGTMHVKDKRAFAFFEQACQFMDTCEALALEYDLGSVGDDTHELLLQHTSGPSLESLLPERKLEKMRRFLQRSIGIDIHPLRHLPPMLVSNLINERLLEEDYPAALDEELYRHATARNQAVLGIESYEEQLAVLLEIPPQVHTQALLSQVRNLPAHRRTLLRLAQLYATGNLPQLHQTSKRNLSVTRQLLLYNRNYHMAAGIDFYAETLPIFAAVGAAHLYGGKGLLRLLKHRGYRVTPIAPGSLPGPASAT